jgi:hypothetical protein
MRLPVVVQNSCGTCGSADQVFRATEGRWRCRDCDRAKKRRLKCSLKQQFWAVSNFDPAQYNTSVDKASRAMAPIEQQFEHVLDDQILEQCRKALGIKTVDELVAMSPIIDPETRKLLPLADFRDAKEFLTGKPSTAGKSPAAKTQKGGDK